MVNIEPIKAWAQWPNESNVQYERFLQFILLVPTKRNHQSVAKKTGVTVHSIEKHSSDFKWRERAAAFDIESAEKAVLERQYQITQILANQLGWAEALGIELEELRSQLSDPYVVPRGHDNRIDAFRVGAELAREQREIMKLGVTGGRTQVEVVIRDETGDADTPDSARLAATRGLVSSAISEGQSILVRDRPSGRKNGRGGSNGNQGEYHGTAE